MRQQSIDRARKAVAKRALEQDDQLRASRGRTSSAPSSVSKRMMKAKVATKRACNNDDYTAKSLPSDLISAAPYYLLTYLASY
jgi:hypothetical protein